MKKAINSSLREKTALKWPALFRYFLVALQLLTVIPLNLKKELKPEDEDIANSTLFFPVVGLIIGGLLFFIYFIFNNFFSPEITSIFILGGWIYLTGALHLDGLADTIDGLSGGKDKEEMLNIMKDTHIGAKGTAGVVFLMLIKLFLIIKTISYPDLHSLIYAPVISRWAMVVGAYTIPYVREKGMGKFSLFISYPHIIGATLITIGVGVFLLGLFSLIIFTGVGGFFLIFSFYLKKKIRGFTGDTLGALCEMEEVVALLIASFG